VELYVVEVVLALVVVVVDPPLPILWWLKLKIKTTAKKIPIDFNPLLTA
jgi:hypothetical protein